MRSNHQPSPFRPAAEAGQRSQRFGTIVLVRPVSVSVLAVIAATIASGVVLLLAFGSYTRRVTVDGVIAPDTGLVKVYARRPGTVLLKNVVEGQRVTRGMVLYTISTDVHSAEEGDTEAALIAQAHQRRDSLLHEINKTRLIQHQEKGTLEAEIASIHSELARLDEQIVGQHQRVKLATDNLMRYERLLKQDFVSTDQFTERQSDRIDQQSKLSELRRARASVSQAMRAASDRLETLALKQQNQLSQLDRSVMDVDQMLVEGEARRELAITAPSSGVATAVIAEPGQTIDTTHPALSILPDGANWLIHLFVPTAAIGFIRVEDFVRIRYDAYPYQKFGQYGARVKSITRSALTAGELAASGTPAISNSHSRGAAFYRVTATLDYQTVTTYGKPQSLQAGMTLKADVLQERRRIYEWVLDPLYSLTGKL